jgi:hypothetical protein
LDGHHADTDIKRPHLPLLLHLAGIPEHLARVAPATDRTERRRLMVEKPIGMPRWLAFLLAWLGVTIFGA